MNFKRIFFLKNQQASNIKFFIDETSKLVQNMIAAGQKGTKIKGKITTFNK